ncbi:hypothetical protein, partial [Cesiribacter andamanensis]|uniref:hypothetical protein n=1 Tax=Cesiribacter andamanensis TaxID=649507 RepID=UPI00058B6801
MEDNIQILVYIVFGIIYLILGALKKRRKGQQPQGPLAPYAEEEPDVVFDEREPTSLEELLERYEHAATRARRRAEEKVETMQEQVDDEYIPAAPNQPQYRNLEQEALQQMQETERLKSLQEELPAAARTELLQKELSRKSSPSKRSRRLRVKSPAEGRREQQPASTALARQIRATARSRTAMQQA